MEDNQQQAEYQKGFNEGYIIAKHMPDLSDNLSKIESEAPRLDGIKDGRKQFTLEQVREHRPAWMKSGRSQGLGEPVKDKGKDIEPRH